MFLPIFRLQTILTNIPKSQIQLLVTQNWMFWGLGSILRPTCNDGDDDDDDDDDDNVPDVF